jgi:C1A family cysteine protease
MVDQSTESYGRQRVLRNDDLPIRVDLRSTLQGVQDQGMRSTCLAFAVTAGHESIRYVKNRVIEDLSEELLYWGCKQIDGDREPGTVFSAVAAALMRWGQPPEDVWPYNGLRDDKDMSYTPPINALDSSNCYKAPMRKIDATLQEMQTWLVRGYAVALGIRLSQGFYIPIDGKILVPTSTEELTEGHAVLVMGYDNSLVPGESFLIIRNSWGLDWGIEGYGYLPYTYIELYGGEAWIVE